MRKLLPLLLIFCCCLSVAQAQSSRKAPSVVLHGYNVAMGPMGKPSTRKFEQCLIQFTLKFGGLYGDEIHILDGRGTTIYYVTRTIKKQTSAGYSVYEYEAEKHFEFGKQQPETCHVKVMVTGKQGELELQFPERKSWIKWLCTV